MRDSGLGILIIGVLLAVLFVGRGFVAPLIIRRRREGTMTSRTAGWLYAALMGGPYLLLTALVAVTEPGALPIVLLSMVLTLPVWIIVWVALYRGRP